MVAGSVVFFPTERFFARFGFFLTRCGRDNFSSDAGWFTAERIALLRCYLALPHFVSVGKLSSELPLASFLPLIEDGQYPTYQ